MFAVDRPGSRTRASLGHSFLWRIDTRPHRFLHLLLPSPSLKGSGLPTQYSVPSFLIYLHCDFPLVTLAATRMMEALRHTLMLYPKEGNQQEAEYLLSR